MFSLFFTTKSFIVEKDNYFGLIFFVEETNSNEVRVARLREPAAHVLPTEHCWFLVLAGFRRSVKNGMVSDKWRWGE